MRGRRIRTQLIICIFIVALALIVNFVSSNLSSPNEVYAYTNSNLLRLHVLANSNSPQDQDLKLRVRDAILEVTTDLFPQVADVNQAKALVLANWDLIYTTAQAAITDAGYDYDVSLELGVFEFPDRVYDQLYLAAGDYQALRILIGEGKGTNWWCVLFPPLCFVETDSNQTADSVISLAPHLQAGDIEIRLRFWERVRHTKAAQRLEEWWVASLNTTNQLALPLLKSK